MNTPKDVKLALIPMDEVQRGDIVLVTVKNKKDLDSAGKWAAAVFKDRGILLAVCDAGINIKIFSEKPIER